MNKETTDNPFWIEPEKRISFYLNNQQSIQLDLDVFKRTKSATHWNKKEMWLVSYEEYRNTFTHWYCRNVAHLPGIRGIRVLPFCKSYKNVHSLMNFFQPFDEINKSHASTRFPLFYGEAGSTGTLPCIRKSRRVDDETSVIYNFRTLRLTLPCQTAMKYDIEWEKKQSDVIWRGATTGQEQRVNLVENYFGKYNIGFATIKQKPYLNHLQKPKASIKEQLTYKFIISLEGNDVASNLRWILASNSVPIMTEPYWHSWIMEERLEPYVHYLPLNESMSNLEELLEWAKENDAECKQIAENGKRYMSQFLDTNHDLMVQKQLLETYANNLTYIN